MVRRTTKGSRERRSDPAWKLAERRVSRWFQEHDGPCQNSILRRLQTSTGRVGHLTALRVDSVSRSYSIEVKLRQIPVWIRDAYLLGLQNAGDFNLESVLVLCWKEEQKEYADEGKLKNLPDMHILSAQRHQQLLDAERELIALKEKE